jgi:hypothetical protein
VNGKEEEMWNWVIEVFGKEEHSVPLFVVRIAPDADTEVTAIQSAAKRFWSEESASEWSRRNIYAYRWELRKVRD